MSEKKNLKSAIVDSGVPLECSVVSKLSKYKMDDMGELEYYREGRVFSTDCWFQSIKPISESFDMILDLVIECKYKGPHQSWYFFPYKEMTGSPRHETINCIFTSLFGSVLKLSQEKSYDNGIVARLAYENLFDVPEVHKGIDISDTSLRSGSPGIISEAVSQVSCGAIVVSRDSAEMILHTISDMQSESITKFGRYPLISLTVPIIVTTAQLFRMKEDVTLEQIEESDRVEDLFEDINGVCLSFDATKTHERFIEEQEKLRPIKVPEVLRDSHLASDCVGVEAKEPIVGRVYILSYQKIEQSLDLLMKKIESIIFGSGTV